VSDNEEKEHMINTDSFKPYTKDEDINIVTCERNRGENIPIPMPYKSMFE